MLGDLSQFSGAHVVEAARTQVQRADQGAMDDEIGVAPDRRSEMRVAAQVEAEVAVVLVAVLGLGLGAQHDLMEEGPVLGFLHPAQDVVEVGRAEIAALRQRQLDRLQEFAQRLELGQ